MHWALSNEVVPVSAHAPWRNCELYMCGCVYVVCAVSGHATRVMAACELLNLKWAAGYQLAVGCVVATTNH